jgi:hypothetical protein
MKNLRYAAACALACMVCAGCPIPMLDQLAVSHAKDVTPPTLLISSPAEGSASANIVEVRGTVSDLADGGTAGKVTSLSYEVLGTAIKGSVDIAADGSYVFQFETTSVGTQFTLQLTAKDWNGNVTTKTLSLTRDTAAAIPGFQATSSSKTVTLTWNAVPKTQSYTLYYTTNGSLPSATNGVTLSGVTSPFTPPNCPNGSMCVFQLVTNPEPGWTASTSDFVKIIPLSPRSLAPHAYGEIGQIRVQWPEIAATSTFEVYRSSVRSGGLSKLAVVTGAEFVDAGLSQNQDYYYAVKPAAYCGVMSEANGARVALSETIPSIKSTVSSGGRVAATLIVGSSYLYMSNGVGGFKILGLSNPASPTTVRTVTFPADAAVQTWSEAEGFSVSGTNLVVAIGSGVLYYTIADPANPIFIRGTTIASAKTVQVNGAYVYVGCQTAYVNPIYTYGVKVVNLATGAVVQTIQYVADGTVPSLALQGSYLYAAEGSTLHVLDVTSPGSIVARANLALGGAGFGPFVVLSGTYAYVAVAQDLEIISISNPLSPTIVKTIANNYQATGMGIWGQRCLLFSNTNMVFAFDITDPTKTFSLYSLELPTFGVTVCSTGSYAYAGVWSLDSVYPYTGSVQVLFDPGMYVQRVAHLSIPYAVFHPLSMALSGTYVFSGGYVDGGAGAFAVYDLSQPATPSQVAQISLPGGSNGVAVSGNYAYVTDLETTSAALHIIDIHNPRSPQLVRTVPLTGQPSGVDVYGDVAIVSNLTTRLSLIDISDPLTATVLPQSVLLAGKSLGYNLTVYARHAYVIATLSTTQLECIDLTNLNNPMANISQVGMPPGISGAYAYSRDKQGGNLGMYVTNISDPFQPASMGFAPCPGTDNDAVTVVSGGFAYSPSWQMGIQRFWIANPRTPTYLGTFPDTSYPQDIAIMGNYAVAILTPGANQYLDVYQLAP